MNENVKIRWEYEGKTDIINGTGAYFEEKFLGYFGSAVIPVILAIQIMTGRVEWSLLQIIVAMYLALDIGGGLVSNALNSCKRFYDSPYKPEEGRTAKYMKKVPFFIGLHIHPLVVGLYFNNLDWFYALAWYSIFIICVIVVYKTPLYLKRPVGNTLTMLAILLNLYIITPVLGFEWFIPLLFIKIVSGHLVREEPYDK